MEQKECANCGKKYQNSLSKCPNCGSSVKKIYIEANSSLGVSSHISRMKGKKPNYPGKHKKVRWEWTDEDRVQRGDGQTKIHCWQLIDRDQDIYEETVIDLQTGETIRDCKEKLSEHIGHSKYEKQRKSKQ